jgi:hypothetical protein
MQLGPSSRPASGKGSGLQGFHGGVADGRDLQCAPMCADMQRFGDFGAKCPKSEAAV